MGSDTFLKLLVAQMKYQDPSNPMSSSELMAQTATLTQTQALQTIADQNKQLLDAAALAQRGRAGRPHGLLHRHRRHHAVRRGQRRQDLGQRQHRSTGGDRRRRRRRRPHHPGRPSPADRRPEPHRHPPAPTPIPLRPEESPMLRSTVLGHLRPPGPPDQDGRRRQQHRQRQHRRLQEQHHRLRGHAVPGAAQRLGRRRPAPRGTNPAQVGLGVKVAAITTNFSQGSTQTTGRSTATS